LDSGEDARVLLNDVTCTVSVSGMKMMILYTSNIITSEHIKYYFSGISRCSLIGDHFVATATLNKLENVYVSV